MTLAVAICSTSLRICSRSRQSAKYVLGSNCVAPCWSWATVIVSKPPRFNRYYKGWRQTAVFHAEAQVCTPETKFSVYTMPFFVGEMPPADLVRHYARLIIREAQASARTGVSDLHIPTQEMPSQERFLSRQQRFHPVVLASDFPTKSWPGTGR